MKHDLVIPKERITRRDKLAEGSAIQQNAINQYNFLGIVNETTKK